MTDSLNKPKDTATADGFFVPRIRGLRESAFWILAGLSVILLLALLSYNPVDPAFSVAGGDGSVANRMGPAGAWFADVAFLLVGETAYLFPVLVLIAGVFLFRNQDLPERGPMLWRGAGFLLTIATSSGLATLHFDPRDMRETAGGILGQLVGRGLEHGLGMLGATVLLLVLWLAAVSLATGVSWVAIMDRVGRAVYAGVVELNIRVNQFRIWLEGRRAKQQREEVVAKVRAKPKAAAPRIEPTIEKVEVSARAERERERERQVPLFEPPASTELPALSLLDDPPPKIGGYSPEALEAMSRLVEIKLNDFGVEAEVVAVHPGPVVTRFELKPAPGVKSSQISNLAKDLARSLATVSVRVVEIIPGKPDVGLEIPNEVRELVALGEIVKSQAYEDLKSPLTLALGKDIGGQPVCADLQRMPHLLIAGTTGSGKSRRAERDGPEPALQVHARARPAHHDRPEDARAVRLRGHPASARASRHRHEAGRERAALVRRRDGASLRADGRARRPAPAGYNKKVQDAQRRGQAVARSADVQARAGGRQGARPRAAAVHRRDHRRARRHDDDRRQEGRRADRAARAESARLGHPHDRRDAAAVRRRHHRPDQGEHPVPHRVPGVGARSTRARSWTRSAPSICSATATCCICRSGTSTPIRVHGAFVSDNEVHAVVKALRSMGSPSYIEEVLDGPDTDAAGHRVGRGRPAGRVGRRARSALRSGCPHRDRDAQSLHLGHSAAAEDRLQPSGADGGDHGGGWHRWELADEWIP